MAPAELDALADLVVRKLGARLVQPIRLSRKAMAQAIDVSGRTLQTWSNQESDPCPCTRIGGIVLYDPPQVAAWLSRQKQKPAVAAAGGGKN
jgi:hypothetical protein